uniref:PHD-type domain-containing protein n=1 Tax=Aegilops tauschii subsp. strangulata TaxID=200361 RepID=A0A452XG90_AEGTS
GGASSPAAPRAMKRELAFALQSLSEITASPGRTRSGRSLLASPALPSSPAKRRKTTARSDPPPLDLVSPPTPPLDAEAPKAALHHAADGLPLDALLPPEVASVLDAEVLPEVPPLDAELLPLPATDGLPLDAALVPAEVASQDAAPPPPKVSHNAAEVLPEVSHNATEALSLAAEVSHNTTEAPSLAAEVLPEVSHSAPEVLPEVSHSAPEVLPLAAEMMPEVSHPHNAAEAQPVANQDAAAEASPKASHSDDVVMSTAGLDSALADPPVAAEDATIPASTAMDAEDAATPVSTAKTIKPKRRFTRSLLGLDRETAASEIIGDASLDLSATPGRRFTRSLLKPKVEAPPASSPVVPEEPVDSTPETPPPVTKMEMKMSKKVACLSKHPGNTRDLLSTGLLEGMPVMYIIPNSKKPVLKGVIAGCNIRCFCVKCDGSKAITTYFFELHAGSSKKHPAEYIYLANGNSLRDVLRACESSPLDSLDKTIQSCIDPMLTRTRTNCLNCNGELPSQTEEQFLCHQCCPESNQPQDPTSPLACSKSSSRLTPSSKESLLKRMSASKGASTGKVTTKDTGLHKLVFKVLLDGTEVTYYVDGQKIIDGYIKDQRIYCNHCNKVVSPSAFEAHAGEGSRRKPYDNIYTSNGVSLHELSMRISKDMQLSERETDDLCRECGLGGDIFPCKMCPRSFHPACVGLPGVPSEEWFCDNCTILVQKEKALAANKNAKAAGRQAGVDSIEQILKRAIRIVPICDDLGGCALCKKKDFNNSVFDERTVILCDQCEKEYHVGCLRSEWQVDLKELPEGEWFCCDSCSEIRSSLDKMISEGAQPLSESDLDIIRKKHESKGLIMDTDTEIRWQLVAGRSATADGNSLLSSAVPVIHQSFDPIIEAHTGRDLIPEMVHGRRPKEGMPGQDYSGMYCAVLTVGSNVVSAALLRVMGGDVAELPLVATSMDLQGLGYFQVLFSCIERLLVSLKVKHFMLPAAHEAEAIWMKKFGFSKIPQDQMEAYLNGGHLTVFHGTLNLYKAVPLP